MTQKTFILLIRLILLKLALNTYSNITSFFRFVNKRAIYRLGIISLAHAPVHVTDFPVVKVHVDELSSARIWQHKLYATLFANVNIDYRLSIKVHTTVSVLLDISESK
jgi:hypothetical protein